MMKIYTERFDIELGTGPDIKDVTPDLKRILTISGIKDGTLNIFVNGSTGSVTTIEYENGVIEDLKRAINELASPDMEYEHEKAWHDGNGHSHVQAAVLGPSLTLPVRDGRLLLGTWQQVVVINHDNRPRNRSIDLTLTGTTG